MTPGQAADIVRTRQGGSGGEEPAATVARALIGPDNQPWFMISKDGYPEFKNPVTGQWVKIWPAACDPAGDNSVNLQNDSNL